MLHCKVHKVIGKLFQEVKDEKIGTIASCSRQVILINAREATETRGAFFAGRRALQALVDI